MGRLVLRLPKGLAEKVAEAAEDEDMLPTEWVRDLIRRELSGEPETEPESEGEPEEPEDEEESEEPEAD